METIDLVSKGECYICYQKVNFVLACASCIQIKKLAIRWPKLYLSWRMVSSMVLDGVVYFSVLPICMGKTAPQAPFKKNSLYVSCFGRSYFCSV